MWTGRYCAEKFKNKNYTAFKGGIFLTHLALVEVWSRFKKWRSLKFYFSSSRFNFPICGAQGKNSPAVFVGLISNIVIGNL